MRSRKPPEMPLELQERIAKEAAEKKIMEEQKQLRFEERQIERDIFRRCGHILEDVTEERHRLVEMRGGLPSWVKALMKKDPREAATWGGERWRFSKIEKCSSCGLVKVSKIADLAPGQVS
ncbi:MAG: hypothetical protein KAX31_03470 [Thermoplasmata archaeon]|nr:hypothetical protein [Thermoplasmata archaeon]